MLLARDEQAATELQKALIEDAPESSGIVNYRIAQEGMRIETGEEVAMSPAGKYAGREVSGLARN